jgi:single-strand DNA-binding protein
MIVGDFSIDPRPTRSQHACLKKTSFGLKTNKKTKKVYNYSHRQGQKAHPKENIMSSVNKVILIGNVGKEVRRSGAEANPVANFTVATNHQYRGRDDQMVNETEWSRVVAFGHNARFVLDHAGSGRQVYIEGRLKTRKWTDAQGVERYVTEIIAENVQLLGPKPAARAETAPASPSAAPAAAPAPEPAPRQAPQPTPAPEQAAPALDDEIPF